MSLSEFVGSSSPLRKYSGRNFISSGFWSTVSGSWRRELFGRIPKFSFSGFSNSKWMGMDTTYSSVAASVVTVSGECWSWHLSWLSWKVAGVSNFFEAWGTVGMF